MAVYHILRDGSRPKDITGHVVKVSDAEPLYRYLHSINQGSARGKGKYTYKNDSRRAK